jgi:large subunit ribosomal protein L3
MSLRMMGFKIGMTHIWKDMKMIPVTVLHVPDAIIVERKTIEKHGYNSLKVGVMPVAEKKLTKPVIGQFKKLDQCYKHMYEIKGYDNAESETLNVGLFSEGDKILVTGTSKGHGFSGVMRRYNFSGQPNSHGSMSHRRTGSIGCRLTPGRVFKGKKMPGHLGNEVVTELGKSIVQVIPEKNLVLIKGGVPGGKHAMVFIRKSERGK